MSSSRPIRKCCPLPLFFVDDADLSGSGMGHSACVDELDAIENFLIERLPKQGEKNEEKSEL